MSSSLTLTRSDNTTAALETLNKGALRSAHARVAAIFAKIRRAGKRIGEAQARALMSGFYYVVLGPVYLVGAKRRNLLGTDSTVTPAWREVPRRRAADHRHQQY